MNKELEQCLMQFVSKALDVANKGIDTAGEQIPMILQEIIQWQLFSAIGFLVLFTTISITGFALSCFLYRKYKQADQDVDDLFTAIISALVSLLFFGASLLYNLPTIIKVLVAPRLVIIEYLKGLL